MSQVLHKRETNRRTPNSYSKKYVPDTDDCVNVPLKSPQNIAPKVFTFEHLANNLISSQNISEIVLFVQSMEL